MVKDRIIQALSHPEAEEGLYFDNLVTLHEDDERPVVDGDQIEILDALRELIEEGRVRMDDSGEKPIFSLIQ